MIDIVVPLEQEGTKAVVRGWLRKLGDTVGLDDPLVELETDKVTQEVPAPAAGVLAEILLDSNAEAMPGAVLGRLRPRDRVASPAEPVAVSPAADPRAARVPRSGDDIAHFLSPSVRRRVAESGVDPSAVAGTGRGGRVTRTDLEIFIAARAENLTAPPSPDTAPEIVRARLAGRVTSIAHDRMRLAIAQSMLNSVSVAPHVTAVFEADFTAVLAHQRCHKASFEKEGAKLTVTAYVMSACAAAMQAAPSINSRWHDDRLDIYDDVNIGIGTALGERGLVVPVVQRVQDLSLLGTASRLTELTQRARAGKLDPADMRGGTFTISNHGVSGSLLATPIIINQPQSAILGIGKLEKRVIVREVDGIDAIQIRPMCYVSLTIDHRAVDGHQTNAWLSSFVDILQRWPAS